MKPHFQQWMTQTTDLVRSGQLKEAMAAIQAAIGGTGHAQASAFTARHASPMNDADTGVIDVQAREVHTGTQTHTDPADKAAPRREEGQFIVGSHTEKSGTRGYKLYIPPHHQDGPPKALVVMLHGCTQDPDDFAAGTRMNEAARRQGFYVLYPAQTQNANSSRCWNWFKHNHQERGRGEPAILAGMTSKVIAQHRIDPRQVYVAGLSAGGAMAAVLGEAYPDLFAAVGVHSGLPVGAAKDMPSAFAAMQSGGASRPSSASGAACPPTIVFHGDRDSTVHPVNGERVAAAGRANGSSKLKQAGNAQGRSYTRYSYRDADDRTVAEHWVVHGAGHAWSGGSSKGSYADPQGPDATQEMLRFFAAHVLAEANC
jgi:poly(hydroxyalkanoate) depolymerase family esterase